MLHPAHHHAVTGNEHHGIGIRDGHLHPAREDHVEVDRCRGVPATRRRIPARRQLGDPERHTVSGRIELPLPVDVASLVGLDQPPAGLPEIHHDRPGVARRQEHDGGFAVVHHVGLPGGIGARHQPAGGPPGRLLGCPGPEGDRRGGRTRLGADHHDSERAGLVANDAPPVPVASLHQRVAGAEDVLAVVESECDLTFEHDDEIHGGSGVHSGHRVVIPRRPEPLVIFRGG